MLPYSHSYQTVVPSPRSTPPTSSPHDTLPARSLHPAHVTVPPPVDPVSLRWKYENSIEEPERSDSGARPQARERMELSESHRLPVPQTVHNKPHLCAPTQPLGVSHAHLARTTDATQRPPHLSLSKQQQRLASPSYSIVRLSILPSSHYLGRGVIAERTIFNAGIASTVYLVTCISRADENARACRVWKKHELPVHISKAWDEHKEGTPGWDIISDELMQQCNEALKEYNIVGKEPDVAEKNSWAEPQEQEDVGQPDTEPHSHTGLLEPAWLFRLISGILIVTGLSACSEARR